MKTVLEMAREAGLVGGPVYARGLEKFAALIRADERDRAMRENAYVLAEREACAKLVEGYDDHTWGMLHDAIRARSNT